MDSSMYYLLMPYLYGAAVEAHESGVPVMRAMPLEFPGDPACDTLERQCMLGERMLVAPVFTPDGTVEVYLPAGRWTNFLSGEAVEGGRWKRERHGYLSLPLMVRPNVDTFRTDAPRSVGPASPSRPTWPTRNVGPPLSRWRTACANVADDYT